MDITKRKITDKLIRKTKEIQQLAEKMAADDIKMKTLLTEEKTIEDIVKMMPDDGKDDQCRTIRPTSQAGKAQRFLKKQSGPAHISDIITGIRATNNTKNRGALASTLRTYAKRGEVFTITAPNTFGLIEWKHKQKDTVEAFNPPFKLNITS